MLSTTKEVLLKGFPKKGFQEKSTKKGRYNNIEMERELPTQTLHFVLSKLDTGAY